MDNKIKAQLEKYMIENGFYTEFEEEVTLDESEYAEMLGDKKYFKDSVEMFKYYRNENYLKEVPEGYIKKETRVKKITNIEDMNDLSLLVQIENINTNKALYQLLSAKKEYKVVTFNDNSDGLPDARQIQNTLNELAKEGWYIKQMTTNELGVTSRSITILGATGATNATLCQTIIVLERIVK